MPDRSNDFDYNKYQNQGDDDEETEDYTLEEQHEILDNFEVEDYLACDKTREILENNFEERFDKDLAELLGELYRDYREYCEGRAMNVFDGRCGYDECLEELIGLVRAHVAEEYSTGVFYDAPILAKPLIEMCCAEEVEEVRELEDVPAEAMRTFDWSTKTYK